MNNTTPPVNQNLQSNVQNPNNQNISNQNLNNQPVNNTSTEVTPKENKKTGKNKIKKIFIFLAVVGLIVIGFSVYLLINENNKYKTYTSTPADLISAEQVYQSGISYNKGTYKYVIDKKEYFYKSDKLYSSDPESLIQIKYNPNDPNDIYNEEMSKYFFIMLFSSMAFSFISIIIAASLSTSKLEEIVTVQVVEQVTCVGGRRIYLDNYSINKEDPIAKNSKYYVYFTNDLEKFALGNILSFNIYKYKEVFITEAYKEFTARTVYDFKNEDFKLLKTPPKKEVNKY